MAIKMLPSCNIDVHDTRTCSTDLLGFSNEEMNTKNDFFMCYYCVERVLMEYHPPILRTSK